MGGFVRCALFITGLFFLLPSFFGLVLGVTSWLTGASLPSPGGFVVGTLGTVVGVSVCWRAVRR